MKRHFLLVLFLVLVSLNTWAQCFRIDSLRRVLAVWPSRDTTWVNTMNLLAGEYITDRLYKNAEYFAMQAQYMSSRIQYEEGEADAQMVLGDVFYEDPLKRDQESIQSYQKALEIYENLGLKAKQAQAIKVIGDYYYNLFYISEDHYQKSLEYYLKYYQINLELNDPIKTAEACVIIGQLYDHLGDAANSRHYFLKAVELKRDIEEEDMDDPHLFSKAESFYKLQIQNQKLNNYLLIGGLGLLGLIIALLTIFIIQKQRSNRLLKIKNDEIFKQKNDIELKNIELQSQTKEIREQRDQLEEQNIRIKEAQDEVEAANEKLKSINQHLEELVEERTQDLRRTNEALVLSNQELDTLIYRASHDFKGPVATLTGLTQIARLEVSESSKALDFFDRIDLTAQKMDGMLEKLHLLSYIFGKDLELEKIDFERIISHIQENLKDRIAESGMQFHLKVAPDVLYHSDPEVVQAVLENLIENAITFRTQNSESSPQLDIHIQNDFASIQIELQDNGVGIPEEFQARIFEMFFRGSEASKGNGLGLYVVKKALERLDGQVSLDSRSGEYTNFTIKLPK
ncbi:MAG: ATP-binding protein [Microscillaceae bacterium]|nr:ATP-binding protein [Microscillaceae bacterium]